MQDEFTIEGAPDSTIWGYDLGTGNDDTGAGWGNNELQSYTNRTENVKVENGYLLITAKKRVLQRVFVYLCKTDNQRSI
jgi:hypothetical protein